MVKFNFKKILSFLMALCMIMSLFTCVATLPASAAAAPDLVKIYKNGSWSCLKYTKGWSTIKAGNYRFTMDCIIYEGTPVIKVGSDEVGDRLSAQSNYVATYDEANRKYIITFTMTSDWEGNLGALVGNYGQSDLATFDCANPSLYLLDSSGNPTGSSLINTFSSDYYSTSRAGNKWNRRNTGSGMFTCTNPIPDNYFAPEVVEPDSYNDGDAKTARFVAGKASYLHYYNNNRTLEAGEYELGFDWNTVYGDGAYLKLIVGGEVISENTFGAEDDAFINDDTGVEDVYNATDLVRTVYFELEDDATGIEIIVGASNGTTSMYVANAYIKALNSKGEVTGNSKINNITASTYYDSGLGETNNNKWNRESGSNSEKVKSVRLMNYASAVFNGSDFGRRVSFNSYTWRLMRYHDYYDAGIKAGTTYKFTLDYRKFSEVDLTVRIKADGTTVSGTKEYDSVNRKYYVTFTATANADALEITIGNEDYLGIVSIGHASLYALDANGNAVGNSLIDDINSQTLDLTYSSTEYDRVWNTRGVTKENDGIYIDTIPNDYFCANTYTDKAVYFPAGYNEYQVLAYKDANTYMLAGTYQLTVDYAKLAGSATVQLRTDTEIGSTVSATSVTNEGTKYTYTYTLSDNARGVGVFLGNYGNGVDMAAMFKNVAIYKVVDGKPVGENLVEPLNSNTAVIKTGNTRANAANARWSSLNYTKDNTKLIDIDTSYFEDAVVTTGTPYMAIFQQGYSWNDLEYNDNYAALEKGKTYVLTIDERDVVGTPTVALYKTVGTSDKSIANYSSEYTDVKNGTTRTITFTMSETVNGIKIRVGNYSDNKNVAGKYANVKLVELGYDANLIKGFSSDNFTTTRENMKWHKAGYFASGNIASFYPVAMPEDYLTGESTDKMFYITDITTNVKYGNSILNTGAMLEAGKTYTAEIDWSAYKGLDPALRATYKNTEGNWVSLEFADFDGDFGHYTTTFTMPDDTTTSGIYNIQIGVGADIKNDDVYNYGRGAVYFGNFALKAEGSDVNILANGDLKLTAEGDLGNTVAWNIGVDKNNGSRDMYGELKVLEQPENFFTADGATAEKMVKFNGGSYDYIRQTLVLENSTTYRLTYKYMFVNAPSTQYIELIDANSKFSQVASDVSTFDADTRTRTVEFTTLDNMRDGRNNAQLSFLIESKGNDVKFNFADVKLYKVVDGETVGHNLIENGGFYFGDEITLDDELKNADKAQRTVDAIELLGWEIYGTFEANTNVQLVNMTENSFPSVIPQFAVRLVELRKILLGKKDIENNPHEDINGDGKVNLKDLVRTKKLAADAVSTNGAGDQASIWKSENLNGSNATDTSKITGTIYYVDAVNGNDNNDGKSPEKAWRSISKVNSKSYNSGDAVLFKAGQVWRPSSVSKDDVLTTKSGVTYGAYGTGAKPQIVGSVYNYATRTWTQVSTNVWKTSVSKNYSVGIVVYNGGELIGSMTKTKDEVANGNIGDFCHYKVVDNNISSTDEYIYVNCPQNPATYWNDIEIGTYRTVVSLASNVTMDNIAVMYTGYHGMDSGSGVSNITIQNCIVSYIGGSYNDTNRLGNGIQFGISGSNLTVKDTYVSECYDAGITFQTWDSISGNGYWRNLSFTNNLVENCNYAFEWFNLDATPVENIVIDGNIFRGAGYGWSYDERIGYGDDLGIMQTSLFRVGGGINYTGVKSFQITNNLFDSSKKGLVYWWWNSKDNAEAGIEAPIDRNIYTISGNSFYQERNGENVVMIFENEGHVQGISSYGIKEALKKFEGVEEPTGEALAVINDDTIIVE